MFSSFRNRFGIPGVISVIALVFAMFGGAYAASNSGSGKGATASAKKAAKGPRGPKGATGPAGPAGPQGPAGAAGVKGDAGAAGAAGEKGATGASGQSVAVTDEPPSPNCTNGGKKLVSASGTDYVCNGEQGIEGSPWTAGGTLPVGATEMGTWMLTTTEAASPKFGPTPVQNTAISFAIPLTAALDASHVHYVTSPGGSCTGSVANPTAASGHLCVYEGALVFNAKTDASPIFDASTLSPGAGVAGAYLQHSIVGDPATASGTWAVTG